MPCLPTGLPLTPSSCQPCQSGWTYLLTGALGISGEFIISGANTATTIIDGDGNDRVFDIAASATVSISGVTITGGNAPFAGGGILNRGTLMLSETAIVGNLTGDGGDGGGIANAGGSVSISRSTISGNTAGTVVPAVGVGGGLSNTNSGSMEVINSTISSNVAGHVGAGIYNENSATLTLTNVTIAANTASSSGGGIENLGNTTFKNTIISDCSPLGPLTSLGHNLVGINTGCPSDGPGDITFTPATIFTTVLGPLQDNGGSTETHALLTGSPAFEAGDNTACPTTDQRGVVRPQGLACDVGAFEDIAITIDARALAGTRFYWGVGWARSRRIRRRYCVCCRGPIPWCMCRAPAWCSR